MPIPWELRKKNQLCEAMWISAKQGLFGCKLKVPTASQGYCYGSSGCCCYDSTSDGTQHSCPSHRHGTRGATHFEDQ